MGIGKLREKRKFISESSQKTLNNMHVIADESLRVANAAHNSKEIFDELETEFESQTGLDSTDVKILFVATALQMARWILIAKLNQMTDKKITDNRVKDNDYSIKEMEHQKKDKYKKKHDIGQGGKWEHNKSKKHRSWLSIVCDGVPYDVVAGFPKFGINMGGGNHRIHTLGHDPVLGWIFGTINILSDTITLEDFRTYKIAYQPKPKHWVEQSNIRFAFLNAIDSIREDKYRLPAAIFAQGLHLASDITTKKGLPIPVLETFSPELAGKLYSNGYDTLCLMKDITVIGSQAVIAILINMLIILIHGLYYDSTKYTNRDVYEVKTKKIIMYSDLISSTSNLLYVGGNVALGNESVIKSLDIGGLVITIHRLVTDTKFIRKVKEEFVYGGFNRMIQLEEVQLEEVDIEKLIKL